MGGRATRALAPALLILALVALVAIASTGSSPGGSGETRAPEVLLDVFFSLVLVAFIPAAAILVWGLMQRREIALQAATRRYRRMGLLTFLLLMAAVGAFGWWRKPRVSGSEQLEDVIRPRGGTPTSFGDDGAPEQYQAEFAWLPVLAVVLLAAIAFAAYYASNRRRRYADDEATVALAVAAVLDDTLDDLRAESDPRKAVIAAYARLERTLAAHGYARRAAETPDEYLRRILPRLAVELRSIRRLTDLFTRAKFSQHDVSLGMKEEAIDALVQVRDELRATAADDAAPAPLRPTEGHA